MSWPAVIVFAVLATCVVVVVAGYFRGNRKMRAARVRTPITLLQPEPDKTQAQSDSWI